MIMKAVAPATGRRVLRRMRRQLTEVPDIFEGERASWVSDKVLQHLSPAWSQCFSSAA
jgi:hypothetical protein